MNRRQMLGYLAAAVAGSTLDPERLLWRPGAKLISVPSGIVKVEAVWIKVSTHLAPEVLIVPGFAASAFAAPFHSLIWHRR